MAKEDTSPPQCLPFFTSPSSPFGTDPAWYPDSGATHHLTNDPNTLSFKNDYSGHESVCIGDGTCLKISSTGSFNLRKVLHVLVISKNLLSVHQFTTDNDLNFTLLFFLVKDQRTGKLLLRGPTKNGLYHLKPQTSLPSASHHSNKVSPAVFVGEKVSISLWHNRLGHPSPRVVNKIVSHFSFPVISNKDTSLCEACQLGKSHKLLFSSTYISTKAPLDLIYSDVWGRSSFHIKSTTCVNSGKRDPPQHATKVGKVQHVTKDP